MELKDRINAYRDDLCDTLRELIQIPSVAGEPQPGMPYGEQPAKALKYMLDIAQSMGFRVKNCGNRAGHAEYGEGDEYAAVLVHLDVVPAGGGWVYPPFGGVIEAGRIYGRGACDNKGPAVAALYCLKALKDAKVRGKRRIRVIFGCDEERGMGDIPYYFEKEPLPVMAFTPDAEYPIYNREKGLLHMDVDVKGLDEASPLRTIEGGLAPNVVPDKCVAIIKKGALSFRDAEGAVGKFGSDRISVEELENGDIRAVSTGVTAHASRAHLGFNACMNLAKFLCFALGERAPVMLKYADSCVGLGTDGQGFGIKSQDDSGALTINIGILRADETGGLMTIDIRYPVSEDGEKIIETIEKKSKEYGCEARVDMHKAPLNIPESAPLIQKLSKAYERATGKKAEVRAQGGATYARTLENRGVAFGAAFEEGKSGGVHEANECIVIDELMRHCEICVEAMKELME